MQSHLPVTQLDLGHASHLGSREVDRTHPFDLEYKVVDLDRPPHLASSNMSLPFLPFTSQKTEHLMKVDITTVTTVSLFCSTKEQHLYNLYRITIFMLCQSIGRTLIG